MNAAPGVLAVKADYQKGEATLGTAAGQPIARTEILNALKSIGYSGKFTSP